MLICSDFVDFYSGKTQQKDGPSLDGLASCQLAGRIDPETGYLLSAAGPRIMSVIRSVFIYRVHLEKYGQLALRMTDRFLNTSGKI